jgi:hypothetical protein
MIPSIPDHSASITEGKECAYGKLIEFEGIDGTVNPLSLRLLTKAWIRKAAIYPACVPAVFRTETALIRMYLEGSSSVRLPM